MFHFWLVWRYLKDSRRIFDLTNVLTLFGIILGVASLVVSMAVVSGFDTTLQNAVIDVFGHVLIIKRNSRIEPDEDILRKIKASEPRTLAITPYVQLEAVAAQNGQVSGVLIQGVDPKTVERVLRIRSRLIDGQFDLTDGPERPTALIGKGVARRFSLHIGDDLQVILPQASKSNTVTMQTRIKKFKVAGILDLGKHDYDERFIITPMTAAQQLAEIGSSVTGLRIRISDPKKAKESSTKLAHDLGYPYWTMDWTDVNSNLMTAVGLEKTVLFFVLLIIIVAACFNVAITLFVTVLRRVREISILRAMGADRMFIVRLFASQGLFIGTLGSFLGVIFGVVLSRLFLWAQVRFNFFPGDIYKLDRISVELRYLDLFAILFVTLLICWLSTLAPARQAARLNPVEGIKHD